MHGWWRLCTLYLPVFQVGVSVGDRSSLLLLCDVFQALINSLVCWFSTLSFVLAIKKRCWSSIHFHKDMLTSQTHTLFLWSLQWVLYTWKAISDESRAIRVSCLRALSRFACFAYCQWLWLSSFCFWGSCDFFFSFSPILFKCEMTCHEKWIHIFTCDFMSLVFPQHDRSWLDVVNISQHTKWSGMCKTEWSLLLLCYCRV